jgi:hypothetical protein
MIRISLLRLEIFEEGDKRNNTRALMGSMDAPL